MIDKIKERFPSIPLSYMTYHPAWIKNQSLLYRNGVFLLLVYDVISPTFGKIQNILVVNDIPLMVFESEFFCNHYNSYR